MSYNKLSLQGLAPRPVPGARVDPIGRLAKDGKWRVEAMRSYSRPVLIWFTRGQGRITVAGTTRGYGTHHAIFLPPETMHGFQTLGHVLGFVCTLPAAPDLSWPTRPIHAAIRDGRAQMELTGLIEAIDRETAATDPMAEAGVHHACGTLSVWLARNLEPLAGDAPAALPGGSAQRLTRRFTDLVERDFRSDRNVASYADELGVTATHLSRCCNTAGGRPAHAILTDRKLFEARRMLAETATPIGRIASGLGFSSAAYFTRAFRRATGDAPSEFRARLRT